MLGTTEVVRLTTTNFGLDINGSIELGTGNITTTGKLLYANNYGYKIFLVHLHIMVCLLTFIMKGILCTCWRMDGSRHHIIY